MAWPGLVGLPMLGAGIFRKLGMGNVVAITLLPNNFSIHFRARLEQVSERGWNKVKNLYQSLFIF